MNEEQKQAVLIIIILAFIAGVACEMITGNIWYNQKLSDKINTIVDSHDPRFRIGDDVYRIERVNNSVFEVNFNDTTFGTP